MQNDTHEQVSWGRGAPANSIAGAAVMPVERLANSLVMTEQMVCRLEKLADVLVGAIPQPVDNISGKLSGGGGVFGNIGLNAGDLAELATRGESALNRIFGQLP